MLRTEPNTLTLFDAGDRTVTVEGRRTSFRVSVGSATVFADYTRPLRVVDRCGRNRVEHRIPDVTAMGRLALTFVALLALRPRRRHQ